MAETKVKIGAAITVIILLVCGIALLVVNQSTRANDSVRKQVTEIIGTNNWNYLGDNAELQLLLTLGPKLWSPYRTWLSGARALWSGVTRSYGLPCPPSCATTLRIRVSKGTCTEKLCRSFMS